MSHYTDLRGLTFRQCLNLPHIRELCYVFVILTALFVWQPVAQVPFLLLGLWSFNFLVIWVKWKDDNRPRHFGPPARNPPPPMPISEIEKLDRS